LEDNPSRSIGVEKKAKVNAIIGRTKIESATNGSVEETRDFENDIGLH